MNSTSVIKWVASRPVGEYRHIMGQIRKAWRAKNGKSVRRLRMKRDTEDISWSTWIRNRDELQCCYCGGGPFINGITVDAAHIVPRRYAITRRCAENGLTLCHTHHQWAHREESEFLRWWAKQYPERLTILKGLVPAWKGWTKL